MSVWIISVEAYLLRFGLGFIGDAVGAIADAASDVGGDAVDFITDGVGAGANSAFKTNSVNSS